MTKPHLSPVSCAVLAAAALALAGVGPARADAVVKYKPTAANLKHFVVAQGDLPDGYKPEGRMSSRSPGGCVDLGGNSAVSRSYERKLRALGFRRCASASFSKKIHTQTDDQLTTEITNEPGSEAILMRDRRAATKALPLVRRTLLQQFTGGGSYKAHSIPAPGLGSEAPRGIRVTYELGELFGTLTASYYVWRRGPVVGWVGSGHVPGEFDDARTLELARKVDSRIAG